MVLPLTATSSPASNLFRTSVFLGDPGLREDALTMTTSARLLLIAAAMLSTSVVLAAQRTYDKRLDAPPGGQLTVDTDVGSVSVVGTDSPEVTIHADLQGSESLLNRLQISTEQNSSGVTVSARVDNGGWLDWLHWFDSGASRVHFAIEVRRDYPLNLRSSGGNLDVRDLKASVRARSSGGGIVVQNIVGAVNAHTSGGGVEARHLEGSAELSTSGGRIDITDSTGELDLNTSGGGIRIQNDDGRVHAHTSGGRIRAQLRSNHGISLSTSGGSITLLLPENTQASIEAESSGGGVTSAFPLSSTQIAAGNHLRGTIGGGGARISLHTSGGSIRIEPEK